ncbi:MAG: class II glutamine amidotransferase, partial [Coriobacteriia bacterium]|nr:class II glutamine amidotransferase [Coriobacteriia bacterium]
MCGIIGYVGAKPASPVLLEGLRRLEYRGYDSAGIAVLDDGALVVRKKKGKIDEGIAREVAARPVSGSLGIAHTRWATHGEPSDENSHPHLDASGRIAVVHNGVIENYEQLKVRLERSGHEFASSTDTEVLAHLIGDHYERCLAESAADPLTAAVEAALREVIGTYGIAVVSSDV